MSCQAVAIRGAWAIYKAREQLRCSSRQFKFFFRLQSSAEKTRAFHNVNWKSEVNQITAESVANLMWINIICCRQTIDRFILLRWLQSNSRQLNHNLTLQYFSPSLQMLSLSICHCVNIAWNTFHISIDWYLFVVVLFQRIEWSICIWFFYWIFLESSA